LTRPKSPRPTTRCGSLSRRRCGRRPGARRAANRTQGTGPPDLQMATGPSWQSFTTMSAAARFPAHFRPPAPFGFNWFCLTVTSRNRHHARIIPEVEDSPRRRDSGTRPRARATGARGSCRDESLPGLAPGPHSGCQRRAPAPKPTSSARRPPSFGTTWRRNTPRRCSEHLAERSSSSYLTRNIAPIERSGHGHEKGPS